MDTNSTNHIQTPYIQNVQLSTGNFRLASGFKRWLASFIDGIIQNIPILLMIFGLIAAMGYMDSEANSSDDMIGMTLILGCGGIIAFILLYVFLLNVYWPATHNGQTFGKKLMGIRIIDEYGNNPTLGKHFLRYFLQTVMLYFIGPFVYITILFHDKKQAVYDLIINTFVIEA